MKFTKIPEDTFRKLQLNAGVLLRSFDPSAASVVKADIVGATSGGINFSATPEFSDFGEDIDNCPKGTMELMRITNWDISIGGTFIAASAEIVSELIAAADISGNKITPRKTLNEDDFKELWWVGDYSDENGEDEGGFIAIHMMNTLSTGGFSLTSGDRSKGQFAFTYKAHYSISDEDAVPFEVYVKEGGAA